MEELSGHQIAVVVIRVHKAIRYVDQHGEAAGTYH